MSSTVLRMRPYFLDSHVPVLHCCKENSSSLTARSWQLRSQQITIETFSLLLSLSCSSSVVLPAAWLAWWQTPAGALAGAAVPSGGRRCHPGCSCGLLEVRHGCCISQIVLWCGGDCTSECCWTQPVTQKINKATRPGASYVLVNIKDNKPHTFLSVWSKVHLHLCSEKCMKCWSQALSAKETLLLFLLDAFLQLLPDRAHGAAVQKMLQKPCSGVTRGWISILACMGTWLCLPCKTIHAMRVHCPQQGVTTAELPGCSFRTDRVLDRGELSVEERAKWYSICRK